MPLPPSQSSASERLARLATVWEASRRGGSSEGSSTAQPSSGSGVAPPSKLVYFLPRDAAGAAATSLASLKGDGAALSAALHEAGFDVLLATLTRAVTRLNSHGPPFKIDLSVVWHEVPHRLAAAGVTPQHCALLSLDGTEYAQALV